MLVLPRVIHLHCIAGEENGRWRLLERGEAERNPEGIVAAQGRPDGGRHRSFRDFFGTVGRILSGSDHESCGMILINSVQTPGQKGTAIRLRRFYYEVVKAQGLIYVSPSASCEVRMSTETLLIIILVLFLFGGGWGYSRWRG